MQLKTAYFNNFKNEYIQNPNKEGIRILIKAFVNSFEWAFKKVCAYGFHVGSEVSD